MTPDQIHKLGLAEVRRIEGEMRSILREAHFTGTIEEFEETLWNQAEQRFETKEEILIFCRNIASIVEPHLPKLFKRLPRMPFGVRAISAAGGAWSPNYYERPAPDGMRGAFVNINVHQHEEQVKYDKEPLMLHEGMPGHHLQQALQFEMQDVPEFRKAYSATAYVEGWGLYAESLGGELGLYRELSSRFGRLSSERYRAVRLVVDTGMHAFGWSRRRAVDYIEEHAPGLAPSEVDRYISLPGQALAYKIGELKIKALRQRAERHLGTRFDIRDFHDVVLRNGPLPLDLLEQQVDTYLQAAK
jgi:prolyl oligopeptidase